MASPRKFAWISSLLLFTFLFSWLLHYGSAEDGFEERWHAVRLGMTSVEIESLLGRPSNIYPAGGVTSDSISGVLIGNLLFDSYYEKWAFGKRRVFNVAPTFPYCMPSMDGMILPERDDYVLYFDTNGNVVKKSHPYCEVD